MVDSEYAKKQKKEEEEKRKKEQEKKKKEQEKINKQIEGTYVKNEEDIKEKTVLVDRPRKHRYLHIMASKKDKKKLLKQLKYQIKPYPKGEKNEN